MTPFFSFSFFPVIYLHLTPPFCICRTLYSSLPGAHTWNRSLTRSLTLKCQVINNVALPAKYERSKTWGQWYLANPAPLWNRCWDWSRENPVWNFTRGPGGLTISPIFCLILIFHVVRQHRYLRHPHQHHILLHWQQNPQDYRQKHQLQQHGSRRKQPQPPSCPVPRQWQQICQVSSLLIRQSIHFKEKK